MDPSLVSTPQGAVHVLAGTFEATRAALATAIPLARGARTPLVVLVPAEARAVGSVDALMRRHRDLLHELGGDGQLRLCVCSPAGIVNQLLPPGSTIVVGGRTRGWLPTQATRLVRTMAKLGHHVVFVPIRENGLPVRLFSPAFGPLEP